MLRARSAMRSASGKGRCSADGPDQDTDGPKGGRTVDRGYKRDGASAAAVCVTEAGELERELKPLENGETQMVAHLLTSFWISSGENLFSL